MKIAILGSRGIPNNYGGFEQSAENLSLHFIKEGHQVTVYNPDYHEYDLGEWNGVEIKKIFSKEDKLGLIGNFIYDFLCLKDAVKRNFDIILELGIPATLFYFLKRKDTRIVTNIDGLEWKRSKWSKWVKFYLKYLEKKTMKKSDAIITDNPVIQDYVKSTYCFTPYYIGYGANQLEVKNLNEGYLKDLNIKKYGYYLIISRLEPENNIEMILAGYLDSRSTEPFLVVANHHEKYGKYLYKKYNNQKGIHFVGGIYGQEQALNSLRYYAKLYFHGHSVGGTNPSLLEAMNAGSFIVAHANEFNQYVLGDQAFFFKSKEEVTSAIENYDDNRRQTFQNGNWDRMKYEFNWESISNKYLTVFKEVLDRG